MTLDEIIMDLEQHIKLYGIYWSFNARQMEIILTLAKEIKELKEARKALKGEE